MSGEASGLDVLEQYRNISNKLKIKRFLRKPNVTEACESFTQLGQQCERNDLPAYAGLCWIAAARCEGSLLNIPGETADLVRAGRQFLKAEQNDYDLGCPSPCRENLQAGLGCYSYASSRFPEDILLPISLNLEIVDYLKKNQYDGCYTEDYLLDSIEKAKDNLDTKIYCMELLAKNYIESCNYSAALNTFTQMVTILDKLPINGARSEILLKCEINRVFLLLILRPIPQKLSPDSAKLLEKYTWGVKNDKTIKACGMTEQMFLLLQSLVAVCQSSDITNLISLESELWHLLGTQEKDLLRILVQSYRF